MSRTEEGTEGPRVKVEEHRPVFGYYLIQFIDEPVLGPKLSRKPATPASMLELPGVHIISPRP
jgi:hypothetical protein